MKTTRIAPGHYSITAPKGVYLVDRHEFDRVWLITYPGRNFADEVTGSLTQAKALIAQDSAA